MNVIVLWPISLEPPSNSLSFLTYKGLREVMVSILCRWMFNWQRFLTLLNLSGVMPQKGGGDNGVVGHIGRILVMVTEIICADCGAFGKNAMPKLWKTVRGRCHN